MTQDRRAAEDRVGRVANVAVDRRRRGMPVVEVEHVDRPPICPERLESSAAEQPEPPRVVRVVAGRVAVEAIAIEGSRMVDQPQSVAIGGHIEHGHRADPGRRARVRDAQCQRPLDTRRLGHAPVARQEDVDRRLQLRAVEVAERPRQGVDDVGQAARLGPRFTFGREHRDAHRHGPHRTRRPLRRRRRGVSHWAPKPVHALCDRV